MAASVVMTSGTGTGDDRRSESQMESIPLRSSMSQSVHRKLALSRPGGHGPGMMPMRYLISMGRDRTRAPQSRQWPTFRLTGVGVAHRMNRDSASIMRDPDKPQQIIDAALRVFARKGYWSARVSDVARE